MVHEGRKYFETPIQHVTSINGTGLWIKRDDLIDQHVSGNKIYKLKHNVYEAKQTGHQSLLTFGGAFSNHLAATAKYAREENLISIGIVRGEQPDELNPTLRFCMENGMHLKFVSRSEYRKKTDPAFLEQFRIAYDKPFIIPEGGSNTLGIIGAREMLDERTAAFDTIICPMGTGTTVAGLLEAATEQQRIIGVPIHKHTSVMDDIIGQYPSLSAHLGKLAIWEDFHFGGYAKWDDRLIKFIRRFYNEFGIKLDPIYTSKAMFAVMQHLKEGTLGSDKNVLFIHTGGLQGVDGFEARFGLKLFN